MEAVGLAASVITLIGAASLTSATITRAWGLRGCPQSILTSLNEVEDFKGVLLTVQSALGDLDYDNEQIRKLTARAKDRLEAFDTFLKAKVLRDDACLADDERLRLRKRAKWKEITGELHHEIDTLKQELSSIKHSMTLALAATQLHFLPRILLNIQRVSLVQAGCTFSPTTIPAMAHNADASALEQAVTSVEPPLRLARLSNVQCSSRWGGQKPSIPGQVHESSIPYVRIEGTPLVQRCIRRCPCQCHVAYEIGSPNWLGRLVGSAFFGFSGTPLFGRRTCNFSRCSSRVTHGGSLNVQYIFPSWLLLFAIQISTTWRCLDGVNATWTLTIPRCFDKDAYSDVDECLDRGSLTGLLKVMTKYGMRPYDFVNLCEEQYSLLGLALIAGHYDITSMLIQNGANLFHRDRYGISLSQVLYLVTSLVPGILAVPDDVLEDIGQDVVLLPCHQLILENSLEQLSFQLECDPGIVLLRDTYGFTLLHWAVLRSTPDIVQAIVTAGADVNSFCRKGFTALTMASNASESTSKCKILLKAGAKLELESPTGPRIALYDAVCNGPVLSETIGVLLNAGADPNFADRCGETILHYAASNGSAKSVEMLLSHGAEIDVLGFRGLTVIDQAIIRNNHDTLAVLLKNSAKVNFHWESQHVLHCKTVSLAAAWGDVTTMRLLTEANLSDIAMDDRATEFYCHHFSIRRTPVLDGHDCPEILKSAFSALLESIIPREMGQENCFNDLPCNETRMPGSFPFDELEEKACYLENTDDYHEDPAEDRGGTEDSQHTIDSTE